MIITEFSMTILCFDLVMCRIYIKYSFSSKSRCSKFTFAKIVKI